jgi:hypothetical protein
VSEAKSLGRGRGRSRTSRHQSSVLLLYRKGLSLLTGAASIGEEADLGAAVEALAVEFEAYNGCVLEHLPLLELQRLAYGAQRRQRSKDWQVSRYKGS